MSEPTAHGLRAAFDAAPPYTVGIEDEVMLLDPDTLELVPRAGELLALLDDDRRFKILRFVGGHHGRYSKPVERLS